jgi:hypothetical protein
MICDIVKSRVRFKFNPSQIDCDIDQFIDKCVEQFAVQAMDGNNRKLILTQCHGHFLEQMYHFDGWIRHVVHETRCQITEIIDKYVDGKPTIRVVGSKKTFMIVCEKNDII